MPGLDDIATRVVEVPRQDGEPLLAKTRAVLFQSAQNNKFSMQFLNPQHQPMNLAELGYSEGGNQGTATRLAGKIREAVLMDVATEAPVAVSVADPAQGTITGFVEARAVQYPGIYRLAVGLLRSEDSSLVYDNEILVYVEPNLWDTANAATYFPKVSDIRLRLRDSDPAENELLNDVDFSLTDICEAAISTVRLWNDLPPPLPSASSTNLQYGDIWMTGIQTFLFEMAFEHYRRNRLPYSAGGIAIDDKAKAPEYGQIWQAKFQLLVQRIQERKLIENRKRLYGVVSHWGRWSRWP